MKIEITKPKFEPVCVTLTFETQDELDRFGSLCNFSGLAQWGLPHWKEMQSTGANISRFSPDIAKSLGIK